MEFLSSLPFWIIALLMLGLLILVHEFGHYITGRWLGFQINEFSIGMGPVLFKRNRKGIDYSLRAIPLGGFVAFEGEDGEEDNKNPRAMNNMPWYKRAIVTFAGAGFNILFSLILTAILVCSVGYYAPKLMEITEQSSIYSVAQPGDIVYKVNNTAILDPSHFSQEVDKIADNQTFELTLLRNGEFITVPVKRYFDAQSNSDIIGIKYGYGTISPNVFESIGYSFQYNVYMAKSMYGLLGDMIMGKADLSGVTGPISTIGQIGSIVEESTQLGAEANYTLFEQFRQIIIIIINLLTIISLNLAVMNLLPIPALDGFRLFSALIEGITKKHLPRKVEGIVNGVGLMVILGLVVILEISKLF